MTATSTKPSNGEDHQVVARSRAYVREQVRQLGLEHRVDDAEIVVSELVTNAVLHGGGCEGVTVQPVDGGGVRIEVADRRTVAPVLGMLGAEGMTGRGLRLVAGIASHWGVAVTGSGKTVWAQLTDHPPIAQAIDEDDLLATWGDDLDNQQTAASRYHLELGEVPTELLVAAKSHVDNVVRELTLATSGAREGLTSDISPHLSALIDVVANRFAEPREAIKRQALAAAASGAPRTRLVLSLPADAADAGEQYLEALDAIDAYCRAARLLTLATPPQHRLFRQWYVGELVTQLRALSAGERPRPAESFESRLLREIERVAAAQAMAERSARLYAVAAALAGAATPEAVADAVLDEGVPALGASGGGLLIAARDDRLLLPASRGYAPDVVARLKAESIETELPAAYALRTGEAVWITSPSERDQLFPELVDFEPETVSICAVPLDVQGRRLGALRFSFAEARLFDEDERRFILTMAAQTAQALERAQLQQSRLDASTRLQRSLRPPSFPEIPGGEVAAVYHPLGDGVEVGGDFYDVWEAGAGSYGIAIGDVVGTGPEAAAMATRIRYSIRALSLHGPDVTSTLIGLNDLLTSASASSGDADEVFCTVIVGSIRSTPDGLEVVLASGGHPFPLLRRAGGAVEEVELGGALVGAFPEARVALVQVALAPGDLLLLYTDGVVEARRRDRRMFGDEALCAVVSASGDTARGAADAVEAAVIEHVGGTLADDLAVLALSALDR